MNLQVPALLNVSATTASPASPQRTGGLEATGDDRGAGLESNALIVSNMLQNRTSSRIVVEWWVVAGSGAVSEVRCIFATWAGPPICASTVMVL